MLAGIVLTVVSGWPAISYPTISNADSYYFLRFYLQWLNESVATWLIAFPTWAIHGWPTQLQVCILGGTAEITVSMWSQQAVPSHGLNSADRQIQHFLILSRPQFSKSMLPGEGEECIECWPANSSYRIRSNQVFRWLFCSTVLTYMCTKCYLSSLSSLSQIKNFLISWWLRLAQAEQDPLGLYQLIHQSTHPSTSLLAGGLRAFLYGWLMNE